MNYASVCSGAEAFGPQWKSEGFVPIFHSEIEKNAAALLRFHNPSIKNHGDFTTIQSTEYPAGFVRLLVGGTPCQSFSIAGLRGGLDDVRGNLTLEFLKLAKKLQCQWIKWENVPGVLSADGGRAFGAFLGGLAELGYGFAYRVLDAQHFGVPQRRRRVFVVGCLGDWRSAAKVLFESESFGLSEAKWMEGASSISSLTATDYKGPSKQRPNLVVPTIYGDRKFLPIEHERLQGWEDDWTRWGINEKGQTYELSDTARYHIIGNGWAAPVVNWIAKRIKTIDSQL